METEIYELEKLLSMQESYFENLIELGLIFENSGNPQKVLIFTRRAYKKLKKQNILF